MNPTVAVTVPSAQDGVKRGVSEGIDLAKIKAGLAMVRPMVVPVIAKGLGPAAGKTAERWLKTDAGKAVFSVVVGGVGLGAQALGLTGTWTPKIHEACVAAIRDGVANGAVAVLEGSFGQVLALYRIFAGQVGGAPEGSNEHAG